MGWFKRMKEGITTSTKDKKEIREGLWYKCPNCDEVIDTDEFQKSLYVCQSCGYHERIGSHEYFDILFDKGKHTEFNQNINSGDPLEFKDTKKVYRQSKNYSSKIWIKRCCANSSW